MVLLDSYESFIKIVNPISNCDAFWENSSFSIFVDRKDDIPVSTTLKGKIAQFVQWGWSAPTGGMYTSMRDLAKVRSSLKLFGVYVQLFCVKKFIFEV